MRNAVVVGMSVLMFAAVPAGQSTTPPAGSMEALVSEIRSLRADLNRVAGASIRSQLLVGRLQLQEERTMTLSRQLDAVQQEIVTIAQQRIDAEARLKGIEESTTLKPQEREEAIMHFRAVIAERYSREQVLRQRESSLSAAVAEEQARWTDFSTRLDELERALTSSPR